jgi:hypothetical protein
MSITPKFATITDWCDLSGMGRSVVYEELAKGNLRAVKVGKRTLIDVEHGLTWLRGLPPLVATTGLRRNKRASDEVVSGEAA